MENKKVFTYIAQEPKNYISNETLTRISLYSGKSIEEKYGKFLKRIGLNGVNPYFLLLAHSENIYRDIFNKVKSKPNLAKNRLGDRFLRALEELRYHARRMGLIPSIFNTEYRAASECIDMLFDTLDLMCGTNIMSNTHYSKIMINLESLSSLLNNWKDVVERYKSEEQK